MTKYKYTRKFIKRGDNPIGIGPLKYVIIVSFF